MASNRTVWRLLDTGERRAAENIALNQTLLSGRQQGITPPTLRFLGFQPSALLGFHQSAEQELNLDYCRSNRITVQRRITGGGALYCDNRQLGWELYLHKRELGTADMAAIAQRICVAVAGGISQLGIDARFRPRNDLEVQGRKIGGTGGAFDGDAILYQGTLLIDFDVELMLRVLNIPAEKLSDKSVASARERVTSLAELLGSAPGRDVVVTLIADALAKEFDVEMSAGELNSEERQLYNEALAQIDHPDWVDMLTHPAADRPVLTAVHKFGGGLLRVNIAYDITHHRIKQVWFSGDVFISPRRTLIDLEAALRDSSAERMETTVREFFRARTVDMLGLTPADIVSLLSQAIATTGATA
ncbi:MAG: lipoate--protein ligase family protein [Burkholderiales bacterium]